MEGIIHTGNQVRNMAGRKKDPLYKSFGYAFQGIFTCIRKERNMKNSTKKFLAMYWNTKTAKFCSWSWALAE